MVIIVSVHQANMQYVQGPCLQCRLPATTQEHMEYVATFFMPSIRTFYIPIARHFNHPQTLADN